MDKFWLGGTDAVTEGTWTWLATGDPVDSSLWCDREPNNANNEDCASIYGNFGCLNDYSCGTPIAYICEINA